MTTKEIITYQDDLTLEEIPDGKRDNVRFGIDGSEYEIDLTKGSSADSLRSTLAPYIAKARKKSSSKKNHSSRGGITTKPSYTVEERDQNKKIRERARAAGEEVSDRGRIPNHVYARFSD